MIAHRYQKPEVLANTNTSGFTFLTAEIHPTPAQAYVAAQEQPLTSRMIIYYIYLYRKATLTAKSPFVMPLFMDYHKIAGLNIEEIKNAHLLDLAVQDKYGVKYHQFWLNEKEGTLFCLMEGPSKEACIAVHMTSHGDVPCAITEVESGFYELFMGKGHLVDQGGLVVNQDGSVDNGTRYIMAVSIHGIASGASPLRYMRIPHQAYILASQKIVEFHGRRVEPTPDDNVLAVFGSAGNAVRCAREIQSAFTLKQTTTSDQQWNVILKIGITASQPVTEDNDFFVEATKVACRLCNLAHDNEIVLSSAVNDRYASEGSDPDSLVDVRSLRSDEEEFLNSMLRITENRLSDEHFTIDVLSRDVGVSRPQLYRKIVNLTGKSPHDLIHDLRMSRAIHLLKKRSLNVSEVALEVGYHNPSYFTKCFAEKYGCTPSEFMDASSV